ncbi:two-component system, OmpR family, response regulator [Thermosulfidibacter takaii ABI70S6]|uniref:Two-component system, OmpR family, response regulator n=1 Tax=Thermosulfidibacter takaii (strain DSM 17441 / JCM 13301 / NBRC 103674 / ABI70S6) TaxID=1298851 RepID=A0A0S3QSK0_THET7|nr:response regulator transcription factor [Thermosulfidibacter takaii]BAT71265.1 two-component system, OmpR family, response regulator [Thermosulfidibacter takaii ABI70S6]
MSERILIVEDDSHLRSLLERIFLDEGYLVETAPEGDLALNMALQRHYDLIILDVMLPGKDGFSVCASLRASNVTVPILMLTVKDEVQDKVQGFEAGADDYLTKPFSIEELLARVRALLRRSKLYKGTIKAGDIEVDPIKRKVAKGGRLIELSPKEFELLEYLVRNKGRVIGEKAIKEKVWGSGEIKSSVLKVYIHHLRHKLGDAEGKIIKTVRGVGYILDVS